MKKGSIVFFGLLILLAFFFVACSPMADGALSRAAGEAAVKAADALANDVHKATFKVTAPKAITVPAGSAFGLNFIPTFTVSKHAAKLEETNILLGTYTAKSSSPLFIPGEWDYGAGVVTNDKGISVYNATSNATGNFDLADGVYKPRVTTSITTSNVSLFFTIPENVGPLGVADKEKKITETVTFSMVLSNQKVKGVQISEVTTDTVVTYIDDTYLNTVTSNAATSGAAVDATVGEFTLTLARTGTGTDDAALVKALAEKNIVIWDGTTGAYATVEAVGKVAFKSIDTTTTDGVFKVTVTGAKEDDVIFVQVLHDDVSPDFVPVYFD